MELEECLKEIYAHNQIINVKTSGSTGTPKVMQADKELMINSSRMMCDYLKLVAADTALLCLPLDYIAGKMMVIRCIERQLRLVCVEPSGHPLRSGQTAKICDYVFGKRAPVVTPGVPFPCDDTFDLVAMVPLQVYNTLRVDEERKRLMRVRHLLIGGGAVDDSLQKELKDFPNYVWSTYGMTETLSNIALRRLNGPEASEWYRPYSSVEVSLNDEGCLVIDAPLVHEGRLVTNDMAELGKDKITGRTLFRIIGRKGNVINSGGIKIQIEEVERRLRPFMKAPFVITRRADRKFGEVVVLLTEQTDTEAALEVCRRELPHYWVPKACVHTDHIPMTETGKPARAEAERVAAELIVE